MSEITQPTGSATTGSNAPNLVADFQIDFMTREASTGVVKEVRWVYELHNALLGVNRTGTAYLTGSASDPNFIPFDNLTSPIVLGWITGSLPIEEIHTELREEFRLLRQQISLRKTPW